MRFLPKKESEISNGFEPMPKGEYPFTVLESGVAISKSEKNSGKEMVKLNLIVHTDNGDRRIYDYFADWFSEWKLKHFLETTGNKDEYLSGEIDPSMNRWRDRQGYVAIGLEKDKKSGEMKNTVRDYLPDEDQMCEPPADAVAKPAAAPSAPVENDDVPF